MSASAERGAKFLDGASLIQRSIDRYERLQATGEAPRPANDWPACLDLKALAAREPEAPKFIMDDWLPCGYATLIAGHGGVGKSGIALHLAVCVAAEIPFFGLPVERRRVLYLSCEDREGVLHWRLNRICRYAGVDLADVPLEIVDLVGHDAVLWERDPRSGYTVTPAFTLLAERIRKLETELLIVDGISDTFAGNENARGDVKRFVNGLVSLIPADRGGVLLVGHIAKPAAASSATSEGYSGSTGWHNSVRARWYLYPETAQGEDDARPERTGELVLELQKSNLGRTDQSIRFRWDEEAHLFVGEPVGRSAFDRKHRDREEQAGILRALKGCADSQIVVPTAMQGPRTAYFVLSQRPEFPDSLKGGGMPKTHRFRRQIEQLRQLRLIDDSQYHRKDRHVAVQLVLTTEGLRECGQ
jgi:RecA-family ATPase